MPVATPSAAIDYRPDIDGLRAVAVLGVIFFHALPTGLPGGFLGVDVFFVISGFLITGLLRADALAGRLGLLNFYARRVRRIFPALLLMLVCVWSLAYALLVPGELIELGRSMLYSAFFANNFLLVAQAGYFDQAAELKPLLHLWSLSVEEQFYIVWPWLALLVWRGGGVGRSLLPLLIGASFAASLWATATQPVDSFFLPQYRAWELLAGAALAVHGDAWRARLPSSLKPALGVLGLALIAGAYLGVSGSDPLPGWRAALPVAGAGLVLLTGTSPGPHRSALASRPLVAVGLISYPLYLWHWPLLSLARIVFGELSVTLAAGLLALSGALAWATWRFVEIPIRRSAWGRVQPGRIVASGLVLLVMLGVLGDQTRTAQGFPARVAGDNWQDLLWAEEHIYDGHCQSELGLSGDYCLRGRAAPLTHALIGDSHANHFFAGLDGVLAKRGANLLQLQGPFRPDADPAWANVDWLLRHDEIGTVIVAYHEGRIREHDNPFGPILERMISRLLAGGKRVFLILDNPAFDVDPRLCTQRPAAARWLGAGDNLDGRCAESVDYMHRKRAPYEHYVAGLRERHPGLQVIDAFTPFCPAGRCSILLDGRLLLRDRHHLTHYGAGVAFSRLDDVIDRLAPLPLAAVR